MRKIAIALLMSLALGACSPKLDTSGRDEFSSSVKRMTEGLPAEKVEEFRQSLIAIAFDQADPSEGLWAKAQIDAPILAAGGDKINGKTVDEVIKLGYETRLTLVDRKIAEGMGEIQRIKAEREKFKAVFDNIHIDGARYHVSSSGYMEEPVISFKITNSSKIAIKHIYLSGILSSPGRAIPWVSADINYEFSGGLEPGESQNLDLTPNMFGDWKIDDYSARDDLNLKLAVANLEGPDGQELLKGSPSESEAKQVEVASLQKIRDDLSKKLKAI